MAGSSKFQMPALDGIDLEPKFKTAMDDLGRQLSQQFDSRPPGDQARYHVLLYTPSGSAVYQVYIEEDGTLKTSKLDASAGRMVKRNA